MDGIEQVSEAQSVDYIGLAGEIVSAYVANNSVQAAELPALLVSIHRALAGLGHGSAIESAIPKPTTAQIKKSITTDALISFVDGKPYKTLKRHLSGHGLTIEAYRERYGLPRDYPATAAGYSQTRSALAKSLGLGQLRRQAIASPEPEPAAEKPKRTSRPRKGKASDEA